MNNKFKINGIALAVAASQLGLVQVQQASAQPRLEEIVVTARSRQFSLNLVDVQQVEILCGPQSILIGKNTIAYTVDAPLSAGIYANGREEPVSTDYKRVITFDPPRGTALLCPLLS
jgi:hypothetical protein